MPPSTRAGQTGRDDDQATTGNGREEGWLTLVVRILQLANPALTAEEAIVWAMGLVNISNQVSGVASPRPGSGGSTGAILVLSNRSATIDLCDSYRLVRQQLGGVGMNVVCYCRSRLTTVDTPFRGGSARSILIRR
ncbi:uncharacterized protein UHOD_11600 [Ustilago sp. UG-2017b]|nr:uncharacterized protein UHOD_11600 [Ustilago sp. UG-2017b]